MPAYGGYLELSKRDLHRGSVRSCRKPSPYGGTQSHYQWLSRLILSGRLLEKASTSLSGLSDVFMHERAHLFKRLLGNRRGEIPQQTFALPLKDGLVDLATSPELAEIVTRDSMIGVTKVASPQTGAGA